MNGDLLRRHGRAIVLGIYVIVTFVFLLAERRQPIADFGSVGDASLAAIGHSSHAAAMPVAAIGGFWDTYVDLVGVRQQNAQLRSELDRLREEHARLLGVMQENARLRALVGFMDAYPALELVPARVIGRDVSPLFRVTSIRLQANARVVAGMPVVSSAGVVGHVAQVDAGIAQVVLACDPRSSIDVLVQRNRARGVAVGLGHHDDYGSRLSYLLRRDEVVPGDMVVTSGAGGRFPPDLVVGRIARVREATTGLFQDVVIEPAVDFSRLEEVFIIISDQR